MNETFNREQIIELMRCADNHEYFLRKYMDVSYIFDQPDGTCAEDVALKYMLWKAMFKDDQSLVAMFPTNLIAKTKMNDLMMDLDLLPDWIKPGIKIRNMSTLAFANGSKIYMRNSEPNTVRGMSFTTVAISNHIKNMEEIRNVIVPTMAFRNQEIIRFS